jgi:hypothetical protein
MQPQEPSLRQTYLLRIWEEHPSHPEKRMIRFILQEVRTGQREGFGSLDALVAYLRARLNLDDEENSRRPAAPSRPGETDRQALPRSRRR